MRLGVLLDRLGPTLGGAEAHTDALVRRAIEQGVEVKVAFLEGDAPPGATRVDLGRVPKSRPARDLHLADAGECALRAAGCDTVFAVRHALRCDVFLPHGGLVRDAWAARDASRGGASLFSRLAARWSRKRRFFEDAERSLLEGTTGPRVIAVSRALAGRIATVYSATRTRLVVVPNGVDADRFSLEPFRAGRAETRRGLGVPADAYVGLVLAHEPWLKGLATVLRAMARPEVSGLSPAFHLVVGGRRAGVDIDAYARREGVEARVHVAGLVADPRPLYAAADVLVQPTFFDPCSLTTLEALSMGVPVVTTPQNGAAELMGMRGGIAVEHPQSDEGVAVAIRVLADPALRQATGDDARYIATKNRLATRLDQVLDVCRGPSAVRKAAPREVEDEGPPADPCLSPSSR